MSKQPLGQTAQRSGQTTYKLFDDYFKFVNEFCIQERTNTVIQDTNQLFQDCVEIRYCTDANTTVDQEFINEVAEVFTTSNARLRLYNMLSWLDPSQVMYCDTDSVMFLYDDRNPKHKSPYLHVEEASQRGLEFGNGLGMWEDEMSKDEWIEELVIGGAKSYAYRTNKETIVCKQKGITLDRNNEKKVNFYELKQMVLNNSTIMTEPRFQFRWDASTRSVFTIDVQKQIQSTVATKRVVNDDYTTVPFGWEEEETTTDESSTTEDTKSMITTVDVYH